MNEITLHGDIHAPARRIISLAPSITETLFYLGMGKCVVGVTRQCDYPAGVAGKAVIGSFSAPDLGSISSLEPDLIIGFGDLHQYIARKIDSSGPAMMMLQHRTVAGILDTMDAVASLAEDAASAAENVAILRRRLESMAKPQGNPVRTLFLTFANPVITPGLGSYQHDALRTAGAAQVTMSNSSYERVTPEEVFHFDPQIILACGRHRHQTPRTVCPNCQAEHPICQRIVDDIAAEPGWKDTAAAATGHVLALPCDWLCRPGARLIYGIEKIAGIIAGYPA